MKQAKRVVWWFTINGAMLILAGLGLWYGYAWAINLVLFFMWVMTVLRFATVYCPSLKADAMKVPRTVPRAISVAVDLAMVVMMASAGHFIIAAAWFYQLGCEEYIYHEAMEACKCQSSSEPKGEAGCK